MVPKAFAKQHGWPIDIFIGYHQVSARKPDPEGLLIAMKLAGAQPHETFHVGDQSDDTAASKSAKVVSIGAGWGIPDVSDLKASQPDFLFSTVAELSEFFTKKQT